MDAIRSGLSFDILLATRIETARPDGDGGDTDPTSLTVRLATLDAPDPELAQTVLERLAAGRDIHLAYEAGDRRDRYDRALAQAYLTGSDDAGDSVWLQAELVRQGAARVLSHASNPAAASYLLGLEAQARHDGAGIWADRAHAVRSTDPDMLAQDDGSVQLVEGRIIEATQLRSGRVYLNFGADYRTDFTVMIEARDTARFVEAGLAPDALETHRVRVRGWVEMENGPMIRIDHPERIERLDD